jgi:hypothetical protein
MELSQQLTLLVDELLDAHDDTLRLAVDLVLDDWRWDAHVCYLRELSSAGREALASAWDCGPAAGRSRVLEQRQFRSNLQRRGARRCARNGHGEGAT